MGANVSSQTNEAITKNINNVINEFSTNIEQNQSSNVDIKQYMDIEFSGSVICDNVTVRQVASGKLSSLSQLNSDQKTQLAADISNQIKAKLEQAVAQKNSGLNLGQANVSNQRNIINNYIEHNIKNILETNIKSSTRTDTKGNQTMIFRPRNKFECTNLDLSQELAIEQISQNMTKSLVEGATSAVLKNKTIAEAKQKATQTNAGLSLGFGMIILVILGILFFFFKSLLKYIIPIAIVVTLVVIVYMHMQTGTNVPALVILYVLLAIEIAIEIYLLTLTKKKM